MTYRAIIFDLFGTLVNDFMSVTGQTHDELAAILRVPYEPFMKQWREITGRRTMGEFQTVEASIDHVCAALGVMVNADQMVQAVEFRLAYTRRALVPKLDAVSTLTQLKQTGFQVSLLSNCSIEIPILWPETEFADLIESPIFSSRERLKKPDPRIYRIACERLGVAPKDCLYIADGENHELKAAADFGMSPVLIRPTSHEPRGELRQEAREWQGTNISTLSEVLVIVGNERRL
ncbi:MAG: HAD family hydrolase [Deltaproteobacteria bacterium]|nr:HAD family hydrolase [Deltaproteobacteria bacterium]